jgi:hypothetical protein
MVSQVGLLKNLQQVHHNHFPTISLGNLIGCQLKTKQNGNDEGKSGNKFQ